MWRLSSALIGTASIAVAGWFGVPGTAVGAEAIRPAVPGTLRIELRERVEMEPESGVFRAQFRGVDWQAEETAIIICDMWDGHYCRGAAQRVSDMVPRMNRVLTAARNHGVAIVHAPSGTMDVYADTPHRRRAIEAPTAESPVPIEGWCYLDPETEAALPIVDSESPCDDPIPREAVRMFDQQHPGLDIIGYDAISDSGVEIYNYLQQLGIRNVAIMGVHTNMCVLGRSFGIRQMVRLGMNVVLVRDLTDAMYDPREPPYVSHTRGTELVVEHIEKYWCPSIESASLMTVVAGSADAAARADASTGSE